jgi:hypothetical protein
MKRQRNFFVWHACLIASARVAVHVLSYVASLEPRCMVGTIQNASSDPKFFADTVTDDVHRFQESIAGRPYLIEVKAVAHDRWRACIVKRPGVPTALMPFYGATPDEAARLLCEWLTRAHQLAAGPAGTV